MLNWTRVLFRFALPLMIVAGILDRIIGWGKPPVFLTLAIFMISAVFGGVSAYSQWKKIRRAQTD